MQANGGHQQIIDRCSGPVDQACRLIARCALLGLLAGCAEMGLEDPFADEATTPESAEADAELAAFDREVDKINQEVAAVRDELIAGAVIEDATPPPSPQKPDSAAEPTRHELVFKQPSSSAEFGPSLEELHGSTGYVTTSGGRREPSITWADCDRRVPGAGYQLSEVNPRRSATPIGRDGCHMAELPFQFDFLKPEPEGAVR